MSFCGRKYVRIHGHTQCVRDSVVVLLGVCRYDMSLTQESLKPLTSDMSGVLHVEESDLEGRQSSALPGCLLFLPSLLTSQILGRVRRRRKQMEKCQQKGYSRVISVDSKRSE